MTILIIAACAFARTSSPFPAVSWALSSPNSLITTDIPLNTPSGWKSNKQDGAVILTPTDLAEGSIYTVVVTPLQTRAGTIDEVYDIGKKELDGIGTYTPISAPVQQQSGGGWDYKLTIGTLDKDGKGLLAEVIGVKKGDAGGVIILLSDSVDTMQKYSEPLNEALRTIGGAPKPPPATEIAPASGSVDLQYTVPSGWTETKKAGVTVIESSHEDFYDKWRWTLVVMPSQPLTGTLADNFKDYWKDLVSANYVSNAVPLPLLARLSSGNVCAFDGDGSATHKASGAKPQMVSVYLIAQGDRFVPVLGILYGYQKDLESGLDHFIQTARIPGASNAKISLFTKANLVGAWSEGSSSIASYVTSSGGYAGDASIFTGSSFHFQADGTYNHTLIALSGSRRVKEQDHGNWSIDDNEVVCNGGRYSLLGYGADPKAGRFLVLGSFANLKATISLSKPRGPLQATWYKAD